MTDAAHIVVEPPKDWPESRQEDFRKHQLNGCVGGVLVSETERVRVWSIHLPPGGRLPFHRHVLARIIHD